MKKKLPFLKIYNNAKYMEFNVALVELKDTKIENGYPVRCANYEHRIIPCIGSGKTKAIAKSKAKMYVKRILKQAERLEV